MKGSILGIDLIPITSTDIDHIAQTITDWQKINSFNHFLREIPSEIENNTLFVSHKLSGEASLARAAIYKEKIIGILFLHSFNEQDGSIEESIRVAPDFHGQGIGTYMKKQVFSEALSMPGIQKIISWHSAWNKGTFSTNRKCGGRIVDFVENQTFLPNLNKVTDDFKWEITHILDVPPTNMEEFIIGHNRDRIIAGLKKHDFNF